MDQMNPPPSADGPHATHTDTVRAYIAEHSEDLLQSIVVYLRCNGRRKGRFADLQDEANELLNEMTIEAIEHADRYDLNRQLGAWLIGIVYNLVKRHNQAVARRSRYEADVGTLQTANGELDVMELFEHLAEQARQRDDTTQISVMLAHILEQANPADREILTQVDLHGWDYETLARRTGISAGTWRKRHLRALQRVQQSARQNGGY